MRCIYCQKPVHGKDGMTVPQFGAAHKACFEAKETLSRKFKGIDISELSDEEFFELKELVMAEENSRNRDSNDDSDIELF